MMKLLMIDCGNADDAISKMALLVHVMAYNEGRAEKWDFDKLDDCQREIVERCVVHFQKERDVRGMTVSDEKVYAWALDTYGINCPHPYHAREYLPRSEDYRCRVCDITVCKLKGGRT